MEAIKEFIFTNWFYLIGIIYILDCLNSIYIRHKGKLKDEDDIKFDSTNVNSVLNANKKLYKKLLKPYSIIILLNMFWIAFGINDSDSITSFYFYLLLASGYVIPTLFNIYHSVNYYLDGFNSGRNTSTNELLKSKQIKKQNNFTSLLNVFEVLVVVLILKNHFLF